MSVDVCKSDPLPAAYGTEQRAQHDAAITTDDNRKAATRQTSSDAVRQRAAVIRDLLFVSDTAGRPREIAVRGRRDVSGQ